MVLVHPSECANKLLMNKVDIGLVPVAVLPEILEEGFIFDYGICAEGKVRSVILASPVPIHDITAVTLDYQSRTSVLLARILAQNHWYIDVKWIQGRPGFEDRDLKGSEAAVVIGDRSFIMATRYPYIYDLADEWHTYTGLPFVFAVWSANKSIDPVFQTGFNEALEFGVTHLEETVSVLGQKQVIDQTDLLDYLHTNIQFRLDNHKKEGLQRFLNELTLLKNE